MVERRRVFISHSHRDARDAADLQSALERLGIRVWRDEVSIEPGAVWSEAIEKGLHDARGVVVLISRSSARKTWVVYEYAVARTLGIPVVGVLIGGAHPPAPLARYQMVRGVNTPTIAKVVTRSDARAAGTSKATPRLIAKFVENNGELERAAGGRSICMELWLEDVPQQTQSVKFEILDDGFRDSAWTAKKTNKARPFLTDDMNSYGDVQIWMRGVGSRSGNWIATSGLYDALQRYYKGKRLNAEIRKALRQIRDN